MSLNPSLALIPCAYDAGKLYSVLPEDGSGDFTVSRNGQATYFDKDGLLKTAQANEPRFDFDPVTGEFRGVLLEPSATNLILHSKLIGGNPPTGWNRTLTGGNSQPVNSIFGNIDGSTAYECSAFNSLECLESIVINVIGGTTYCISVKIESIVGNLAARNFMRPTGNLALSGFFRLNGVTITDNTNIQTGLLELVFTPSSSQSFNLRIGGGNGIGNNFTGSVVFSRPQIETGPVATSYIPTQGSQVTRPADVIQRTNAANLIGQTEGTLYWEGRIIQGIQTTDLLLIRDATKINVVGLRLNTTPALGIGIRTNNVLTVNVISSPLSGDYYKIAVAYKSGDIVAYVNGTQVLTGTETFAFSDVISIIGIGDTFFALERTQFNKAAALFKTRLSNEQLEALTTL